MEGTFASYITSPLFTFQIGPEKREFTVHSSPLADISPYLHSLINGRMIEAQTRRVDWSDVDEDTFVRLCEYAYIHDYTPPSSHQVADCPVDPAVPKSGLAKQERVMNEKAARYKTYSVDTESTPEAESEQPAKLEEEPVAKAEESEAKEDELPYKEKSIWTRHLRDSFSSLPIDLGPNNDPAKDRLSPKPNRKGQDFTPVFLGHARLYVLADKCGIESLRKLVLSKIYRTLKMFTLYRQSVAGVIEFVRFIYSETLRHAHEIGALRKLATSYVVSILGQLGDDEIFEGLLEEGGDFVPDFWRAVWKEGLPARLSDRATNFHGAFPNQREGRIF